jgi:hypothetical protein
MECHVEIISSQKIRATARPMAFVPIALVLAAFLVVQTHVHLIRQMTLTAITFVAT